MASTMLPERDDIFRETRVPELSRHPEVTEVLRGAGLGGFRGAGLRSVFGRNLNWIGTTESGAEVFVKKILGSSEEISSRSRRLAAHSRIFSESRFRFISGPRCLGRDEEKGVFAFEFLADGRSGTALVEDEEFFPEVSEQVGRGIARLHGTDVEISSMDSSAMPFPSTRQLEGLTESEYLSSSHAMRRMWAILQNDEELRKGIADLLDAESRAEKVPSHCDLRVDQILSEGGGLRLVDWEEFRLADPARDMGSYTGEWLYRAALHLGSGPPGQEEDRNTVAESGADALERLKPQITAFWKGYRSLRPRTDPGLEARATAFAGWHLVERALSGAVRSSVLAAKQLAAAGVGRKALLAPEAFVSTLGIER